MRAANEKPFSPSVFLDLDSISNENLAKALAEDANWDAFDLDRDLVKLRTRLGELLLLDETKSPGPAHFIATEKLCENATNHEATLRNDFIHEEPLGHVAMRRDGKYLAVGTGCSGNRYNEGGKMQIFEVATGRCVNKSEDGVRGGVGWSENENCLQWTHSGNHVVASYNTNWVGIFEALESGMYPITEAYATGGQDSPPDFCTGDDKVAIQYWGPNHQEEEEEDEDEVGDTVGDKDKNKDANGDKNNEQKKAKDKEREIPFCVFGVEDCTQLSESDLDWLDDIQGLDHNVTEFFQQFALAENVLLAKSWGCIHAIDVNKRKAIYTLNAPRSSFSPDCRQIASCWQKEVKFYDSLTGEQIEHFELTELEDEIVGANFCDSKQRIAICTKKSVRILCIRSKKLLAGSMTRVGRGVPGSNSSRLTETNQFSMSPDGSMAATLSKSGAVQVYTIEDSGVSETHSFQAPSSTVAVYCGIDGVIVCVGQDMIEFWKRGKLMHCIDRQSQSEAHSYLSFGVESPVELGGESYEPYDAEVVPFSTTNGYAWLATTENGLILCPEEHQFQISKHVNWSLDCKYSWPWEWGKERPVFGTIYEAVDHKLCTLNDKQKSAIKALGKPPKRRKLLIDSLEGPNDYITVMDILEYSKTWFKSLTDTYGLHVMEGHQKYSEYYLAAGKVDEAFEAATRIQPNVHCLASLAEGALVLHEKGDHDNALKFANAALEMGSKIEAGDYNTATLNCPLYAVSKVVMKDSIKADEFLMKALNGTARESNPGQNAYHIAFFYHLAGEFDKALAVVDQVQKTYPTGLNRYIEEFLSEAIGFGQRHGVEKFVRLAEVAAYGRKCGKAVMSHSSVTRLIIETHKKNGNYKEALFLLDSLRGISYRDSKCMGILPLMVEQGQAEDVGKLIRKEIRSSQSHVDVVAKWAKQLLEFGLTDGLAEIVGRTVSGERPKYNLLEYFLDEMYLLGGVGMHETATSKLDRRRVGYQLKPMLELIKGCNAAGDKETCERCLSEMQKEAEELSADSYRRQEKYLMVAEAACLIGQQEVYQEYIAKAKSDAFDGIVDKVDGLTSVMDKQIQLGDLQGAFGTWKSHLAGNRQSKAQPLIRHCVKNCNWAAVKQLLGLFSRDDNISSEVLGILRLHFVGTKSSRWR